MADEFPKQRFLDAGASASEVEILSDGFDRSDLAVQRSMVDHFKSISRGDLIDYISDLRASGRFEDVTSDAVEAPETSDEKIEENEQVESQNGSEGESASDLTE